MDYRTEPTLHKHLQDFSTPTSIRIQFRLRSSIAAVPAPDRLHNSIYGSLCRCRFAGFRQNNIIPLGMNRSSTEVVHSGPIARPRSIPFSGKENRRLVSRSSTHSGRRGGTIQAREFYVCTLLWTVFLVVGLITTTSFVVDQSTE